MRQSLVLMALLLLAASPVRAWQFEVDGILYNTTSATTCEVTHSPIAQDQAYPDGTDYRGVVTIPATVCYDSTEYQVTAIGQMAFAMCKRLTYVVIPEGVTLINENAFNGCTHLESVTLPESLRSIAPFAFRDCYYLDPIIIPSGVTHIGNSAFSYCTTLTSITLPPDLTVINDFVFHGCAHLEEVNISPRVHSIGQNAFAECASLRGLELPPSVTSIGRSAFADCAMLEELILPESVTSIGNYAFRDCLALQRMTLPHQVSQVGDYTFSGCYSLTDVTLSESLESIGDYAFSYCDNLLDFRLPASLRTIGEGAFCECYELTDVTLPGGITELRDYTYQGCASLEQVTLPSTLAALGDGVFAGCESLTTVNAQATTPPLTGEECFSLYADLHVIEHHAEAYAGAEPWSRFRIIDDLPYMRVSSIELWADTVCCPSSYVGQARAICHPADAVYHDVTWSSADPKTVFIDRETGQYVAVRAGTTTLTAHAVDDSGVTASLTIVVDDGVSVEPERLPRCEAPTIRYADGQLRFSSPTFGAEYHCTLTDDDTMRDVRTSGIIPLSGTLRISVYATAEGYDPSEATVATLHWLPTNVDTALPQLRADRRAILCTSQQGIVSLTGLDEAEAVTFVSLTGQTLCTVTARQGEVVADLQAYKGSIVLVRVNEDCLRILIE